MIELNDNQQRHLDAWLRLLEDDLDAVERLDPVRRDPEVQACAAAIHDSVAALRAELGLARGWTPSVRRRVIGLAEVWGARVEDLRARRLSAYGPVAAGLAERLDPHVAHLRARLGALAAAAEGLPGDAR